MTAPPEPPPATRRSRLVTAARRGYAVALVVVLASVVVANGDDARALVAGARPAPLLAALAGALGLVGLTSAVWSSGLRSLGAPVPWTSAVSATARSLPARYLPGSVWYAATRGAILRAEGAPARALATVAGVEMLLVPVVGFALGGVLLGASGRVPDVVGAPLVAAAAALGLVATPPVLNRVLALLWRRRGGTAPALGWAAVGRMVAWLLVFWTWSAGVFAVYLAAFPAVGRAADVPLATVLGGYMVAWGVGWLAVFAPQGVGVFEVTLASVLGGGVAEVALVLGGYRVVVLVRDLLAAGVASAMARRRRPPRPGTAVTA